MGPAKDADPAAQGNKKTPEQLHHEPSGVAAGSSQMIRSYMSLQVAAKLLFVLPFYMLRLQELRQLNRMARILTEAPLDDRSFERLLSSLSVMTGLVDSLSRDVENMKEKTDAAGFGSPPSSPTGDFTVPDLNATPSNPNDGADGEDKAGGDVA